MMTGNYIAKDTAEILPIFAIPPPRPERPYDGMVDASRSALVGLVSLES